MPYIPPNIVAQAREMDLLTYLQNYEPQELVYFGGKRVCSFYPVFMTVIFKNYPSPQLHQSVGMCCAYLQAWHHRQGNPSL